MPQLPHVGRALEHHVFKEVGHTGLTRRLFGQPDPIIHLYIDQRIGVIRRQDHRQAIIQPILLIRDDQRIAALFLLLDQHWASQGNNTEEIQYTPHDSHVMSQFSSLNIIIVFCCCTYFIFISVASCAAIYLLIRRDIWPWCLISTPSPH